MRAPSAIRRSLRLPQLQPRAPVAVAPLPEKTRFDRELTAELDSLRSQQGTAEKTGLVQLLDAAITTQKIAMKSLVKISYRDDADRGAVDEYLENNVDILDACNNFVDKIENIKKYVDSLRVIVRLVDNNGSGSGSAKQSMRALDILESCENIEKKFKAIGINNRGSCCLRKTMLRQRQNVTHETELSEIMCGSKAMALMGCRLLEHGVSFDSKRRRGLPTFLKPLSCSWLRLLQGLAKELADDGSSNRGSCLLTSELQQTVRELKEQMKLKGKRGNNDKEVKCAVERLKRSCRELEDGLEVIEERVKDLYRSLIHVRMALLGIPSH